LVSYSFDINGRHIQMSGQRFRTLEAVMRASDEEPHELHTSNSLARFFEHESDAAQASARLTELHTLGLVDRVAGNTDGPHALYSYRINNNGRALVMQGRQMLAHRQQQLNGAHAAA